LPQFARPSADVTTGGWTPYTSVPGTLYVHIDEIVRNDADYIYSPLSPNGANLVEVLLSTVTDPQSDQDHWVRYSYQKNSAVGQVIDLTFALLQGTTVIASWTHLDIPATWQQQNQLLTPAQAAAITDYSDLRIRVTPASAGNPGRRAWWSWAELETPDLTLEGSIDGSGQIGPSDLTKYNLISASIDGASTLEATIARRLALNGSIDGASAWNADLWLFDTHRGSIDAQSSLQGSLSIKPLAMRGILDGQGDFDVDLYNFVGLQASTNLLFGFRGRSSFRAMLYNLQARSGSIDGDSYLLGRAIQFLAVDAALDGVSTWTGEATNFVAMSGSVDGSSTIVGDMTTFDSLKGYVNGQSALDDAELGRVPLRVTPFPFGGYSDLDAVTLRLILGMTGSIDAQSSLEAGELLAKITLGPAQGDAQATLEADRLVAALEVQGDPIDAQSTFDATMTEGVSLSGSIAASSTFTGETAALNNIDGSIAASSTIGPARLDNVEDMPVALMAAQSTIGPATLLRIPLGMQGAIAAVSIVDGTLKMVGESVTGIDEITGPGGVGDPEGPPVGEYGILIRGAGFALPPDPPATGYVGGTYPQTVRVEFGGEPATRVDVLSDSLLFVIVPSYRGDGNIEDIPAVDVRVVNLDPYTGEEDPLSEAIEPEGWKYVRPRLDDYGSPGNLLRLVREVLRTFKRQVLPNTALTQAVDYDDTVTDMLNIIGVAELPAIVLVGPTLVNNRFYSLNQRQRNQDALNLREWDGLRVPRTVDVQFSFVGVADKTGILLNMVDVVEQFFESNKWLELDRCPDDPSQGRVRYELELTTDAEVATTPNESNVRNFTGAFEIRGFDIELGVVERTFEVDDPTTDGEALVQVEPIPWEV